MIRRESNSAALNRHVTPLSARAAAWWVALSSVNPKPLREQEPWTHMKCQPAWRIIASKAGASIFSTWAQLSQKGTLNGSTRSGRMHPLRRRMECNFTIARFWESLAQRHGWNQIQSPPKGNLVELGPVDRAVSQPNPSSAKLRFRIPLLRNQLHRAGFLVGTEVSLRGGEQKGDSLHRFS